MAFDILEQIKQGNEQLKKMSFGDFLDKPISPVEGIQNVGSSLLADTYPSLDTVQLDPMQQALAEFRGGETPQTSVDLMSKVQGLAGLANKDKNGPSSPSIV